MDTAIAPQTALAIIPASALPTLLAADTTDILGALRRELEGFEPDASTEKGRKEIGSKSRKVGGAKAEFARLAKTLKEDHQAIISKTNAELKIITTELERLQDRLEAPRKEYEERIEAFEAEIARINDRDPTIAHLPSDDIEVRLNRIHDYPPRDWAEFGIRAVRASADRVQWLTDLLAAAKTREADAAEFARLRAEAAERERIANEERIRAAAIAETEAKAAHKAESARLVAAREQAKIEQEARNREAALKADAERKKREAADAVARVERERQAAIDAAAKAERDRVAAAEKAEQDRIAAESDAKRREIEAVERERAKIAAQRKAEADDRARREADKEHRAMVNRAAAGMILTHTSVDSADVAESIVRAIAKGQIPGVSIAY